MAERITLKSDLKDEPEQVHFVCDLIAESISLLIPKLMERILNMLAEEEQHCLSERQIRERERKLHEEAVEEVKQRVLDRITTPPRNATKNGMSPETATHQQNCSLQNLHQPWTFQGKLHSSIVDITEKCNCKSIEAEIKRFRNHLNAYKQYLHQYDKKQNVDENGRMNSTLHESDISKSVFLESTPRTDKIRRRSRKGPMKIRSAEEIIDDAYMNCTRILDDTGRTPIKQSHNSSLPAEGKKAMIRSFESNKYDDGNNDSGEIPSEDLTIEIGVSGCDIYILPFDKSDENHDETSMLGNGRSFTGEYEVIKDEDFAGYTESRIIENNDNVPKVRSEMKRIWLKKSSSTINI